MGWDTRIVEVRIRVSVHDETGIDQTALCDQVWREAHRRVSEGVDLWNRLGLFPDGAEVEVV